MVSGPWASSVPTSQPTIGMSSTASGVARASNAPAPVGEVRAISVFR